MDKLLWVMNESRAWPIGDGSAGMEMDASAVHVECEPIEKVDGI